MLSQLLNRSILGPGRLKREEGRGGLTDMQQKKNNTCCEIDHAPQRAT